MAFVDFAELKARAPFEAVMNFLGLQMKKSGQQWRGICPACKSGGERALTLMKPEDW